MNKEIQKIIEQELPSQTADVLRKFIDKADKDKDALFVSQNRNEDLEERLLLLQKEMKEQHQAGELLIMAKKVGVENAKRKIELDDKDRKMEHIIMTQEVVMLRHNMDVMQNLVDKVFGHPSTTWNMARQVAIANSEYNAQGLMSGGSSLTPTEDTTVETKSKK